MAMPHHTLQSLRDELENISSANWSQIDIWIAKATPFIRKKFPQDFDDFKSVCRRGVARVGSFNMNYAQQAHDNMRDRQRQLNLDCKKNIVGFMDGLIGLESEGRDNKDNSLDLVINLCKGFPRFSRQLLRRHAGRPTIEIGDEYDVQDLFHALLRLHFKDVRAEEHTPSYAGKAARMDFLLKSEKIVIELKMTRSGLDDKEIGNQLIEDCHRYSQNEECKTLVCYIYDPDSRLRNPEGLEHDLSRLFDGKMNVEVIVSSSSR